MRILCNVLTRGIFQNLVAKTYNWEKDLTSVKSRKPGEFDGTFSRIYVSAEKCKLRMLKDMIDELEKLMKMFDKCFKREFRYDEIEGQIKKVRDMATGMIEGLDTASLETKHIESTTSADADSGKPNLKQPSTAYDREAEQRRVR